MAAAVTRDDDFASSPSFPLPAMSALDELAQVVVDDQGITGIVHALHRVTGCEAAVWDDRGEVVATSATVPLGRPELDVETGDVLVHRHVGDWAYCAVSRARSLVATVGVREGPRGDGRYREALAHAAIAAAADLARQRSVVEAELRPWRSLANALLFEPDREAVRRHAVSLEYDLAAPHRVMVVSAPGAASAVLSALRDAARHQPSAAVVLIDDDRIAALFAGIVDCDAMLRAAAGATTVPCAAGVSSPGVAIEAPELLLEADLALHMGMSGASRTVVRFDDLGLLGLLAAGHDSDRMLRYVDRHLQPLFEYDELHHTSLVETLTVYLDSGAALRSAAVRLVIHESTLKARLHRIRSITGYDLSNPDLRFNLQLACRAHAATVVLREVGAPRM